MRDCEKAKTGIDYFKKATEDTRLQGVHNDRTHTALKIKPTNPGSIPSTD